MAEKAQDNAEAKAQIEEEEEEEDEEEADPEQAAVVVKRGFPLYRETNKS